MDDPDPLPTFRYHPDPVGTGSVKAEPDTPCLGCSRIRGYEKIKSDSVAKVKALAAEKLAEMTQPSMLVLK